MSNTSNLKVSSVKDYKKKVQATKLIELPSGAVFKVRKLKILPFLKSDVIPNNLLPLLKNIGEGSINFDKLETEALEDPKLLKKLTDVMEIMVMGAVVEPKITKEETDESICIDDLDEDDLQFLFNWIQKENKLDSKAREQLNSFRK